MEIHEALTNRRSIRRFQSMPVPRADIEEIVEAGLLAPTASNRQHWRVVAVTDPNSIRALHEKVGAQDIVFNPPVVLTVLYNPLFNSRRSAHVQSSAAAVENMMLKATSMGYGTTWVAGMGDDDELKMLLRIPTQWEPMCYVLLGKVAETFPPPPPKYQLDEVLFFDQFNEEEMDLPESIRPCNCTLEQVKNHQHYLSRSSYLGKDYEYHHELEIRKIKDFISIYIESGIHEICSFYAYDGTVFRGLNDLMTRHSFTDVELSEGSRDYVKHKSPDAKYLITADSTPLEAETMDLCVCLFSLEKLPDYRFVLDESHRILKTNGRLQIFFKNKRSIFGLIYWVVEKVLGAKSISAVFPLSAGPYEPLSENTLEKCLERASFEIIKKEGMFFVPAEVITFYSKVDGYLKRHGKYLSIARILVRPSLVTLVKFFGITRNVKSYLFCSSCYVEARKRL
jgi:nitroreductase/SAM-dependent methyltransferase